MCPPAPVAAHSQEGRVVSVGIRNQDSGGPAMYVGQHKHVTSMADHALTAWRGQAFRFQPELALNAEGKQGHSEKHE